LAHVLFFVLAGVLPGFEPFGDEHGEPLAAHALRRVEVAQVIEPASPQAGFLCQLPPRQLDRLPVCSIGQLFRRSTDSTHDLLDNLINSRRGGSYGDEPCQGRAVRARI